jgi:hypothetical protein
LAGAAVAVRAACENDMINRWLQLNGGATSSKLSRLGVVECEIKKARLCASGQQKKRRKRMGPAGRTATEPTGVPSGRERGVALKTGLKTF